MAEKWFRGRVLVAGVGICLAVSASGCKRAKKKADPDASAVTAAAAAQDSVDEQMTDKLEEYIQCRNTLSASIYKSRARYFTFIPQAGPTGRETYADLFRVPAGATASCMAGTARARPMPPSDGKLEAAGAEFASAASAADTAMGQMESYLERKAFKDDKWARGKTMHPLLVAAWGRFGTADRSLHETIDGILKPLAQRTLARIEREEGRNFHWNRKHVIVTSRELIEASDPGGEDTDVDVQLFNATYTDFEKAVDELTSYGAAHKADLANRDLAPSWPMSDANFTTFTNKANELRRAAKEFGLCLRDAPAKSKTTSGKIDRSKIGTCGDGTMAITRTEEEIRQYNELITTNNSHPFP